MRQGRELELLLSVAKVAELMEVSEWGVRQALKRKRLRSESVLIDNKLRVAIPISAMADYWELPVATVERIEADARRHSLDAPVSVVKRISSSETDADD